MIVNICHICSSPSNVNIEILLPAPFHCLCPPVDGIDMNFSVYPFELCFDTLKVIFLCPNIDI